MKRSPLKLSKVAIRRTPLKRRSRKTARLYREVRVPLVRMLIEEHPTCQRCSMARSNDVHELIPRGRGGSILDLENLVAICRTCHDFVHGHPIQATNEGWLRRKR